LNLYYAWYIPIISHELWLVIAITKSQFFMATSQRGAESHTVMDRRMMEAQESAMALAGSFGPEFLQDGSARVDQLWPEWLVG
jgi:hypothetical protein